MRLNNGRMDVNTLNQVAQRRWLKAKEIYWILKQCEIGKLECAHCVDGAQSGNIRLYNKLEVKQYKKDGHCWQKRKGNDAHVREDHVKLTVDGPNHLYVFATHAHSSRINDTAIPYVLVHYLDTDPVKMQTLSTIDNHVALDQGCETLLENDRTHKSLEISDYVPESDSVYGGTKVLICMASDIPESLFEKNQLLVRFGLDHVPATRVSASVVKCTTPSSLPGTVEMCLVQANTGAVSNSRPFRFDHSSHGHVLASSMLNTSNATTPSDAKRLPPENAQQTSRNFKIRVVEKLSEFQRAVGSAPETNVIDENIPAVLDDNAVAETGDADMEVLSEQMIKQVVKQLVVLADSSPELLDELHSLDEAGLSLIHYVCFYSYAEILPLLISHGASINHKSAHGDTPLHLAAARGQKSIVTILIEAGANATCTDAQGYTAADRAEMNFHFELAATLCRLTGQELWARSRNSSESLEDASTPSLGGGPLHNRTLLLKAFSSMSLHDKCALSLSISKDGLGSKKHHQPASLSHPAGSDSGSDLEAEVASVISEVDVDTTKIQAAMKLMAPEELAKLADEANIIQSNVRAWLLRRSYKHMRDTSKKLQQAATSAMVYPPDNHLERAAVTVQAATRTMLARRAFLQQRKTAIRFQAATRGALCRRKYALMKKHAMASLVIQRNIRAWLDNPDHYFKKCG